MSTKIKNMSNPKLISFSYQLKNQRGVNIETTNDPIVFVEGRNHIFPELENAIVNKPVGSQFEISLTASETFGDIREELIFEVPKDDVNGEGKLGDVIVTQNEDGAEIELEIVEIKEDSYLLNGNHPLAGQDLTYSVEILSSREATLQELQELEVEN